MRKPSLMRHAGSMYTGLNLAPMIDCLVMLIPFLLTTTAYFQVSVIKNAIPNLSQSQMTPEMAKAREKSLELKLLMNDYGYTIVAKGGILQYYADKSAKATIPKINGTAYDTLALNKVLLEIRKAHPELPVDEPLILYPKANVTYNEIVETMDAVREQLDDDGNIFYQDVTDNKGNSRKVATEIFPNVVMGAELVE